MARSEAIAAVSASKPKVDDESGLCWRKEVDQNLKRLQWLLFGADTALEKGDEAFILSIREAVSKLVSARRASIPDSDRVDTEGTGADVNANADAMDIEGIGVDINANADAADIDFEGMRPAEYRGAGLINESSYCYVNAVLQCFVHTAEFFEHIVGDTHSLECTCNDGFCLSYCLESLFQYEGALIYRLFAIVVYEHGHIYTLARIHPNKWFRYDDERTVVDNQNKSLILIESWGEFSNELLPVYGETYKSLKSRGVWFPARDKESLPPVEPSETNANLGQQLHYDIPVQSFSAEEIEEAFDKTRNSIKLLSTVAHEDESATNTLLEQLHESRVIVQRIIEAAGDNEAVLFEALDVNHEIQEVLSEYKEMKRPRVAKGGRSPP
ncbi:hypothetical protein OROMI_024112 [Orobanche minor]